MIFKFLEVLAAIAIVLIVMALGGRRAAFSRRHRWQKAARQPLSEEECDSNPPTAEGTTVPKTVVLLDDRTRFVLDGRRCRRRSEAASAS